MTGIRFKDILEARIRSTLKTFIGRQLSPIVLREIKSAILSDVKRVFLASGISLHPDVEGWLANQFFKNTRLNGEEGTMLDLVIIKEYELSTFSDSDVRTLYGLFSETQIFDQISEEYKRRFEDGTKAQ